jgi:DNA ligase-associated metallophosphoesterase
MSVARPPQLVPPRPATLDVADRALVLHPERAVEWPAAQTLFVADLHWGKATALRAHGVPVPVGGTADDLARLDDVLVRTGVRQLVVLGDLAHSWHAWTPAALGELLAWRARWPDLAITLVRGNHDAHGGDPPVLLGIEAVDAPWRLQGVTCWHEPPEPSARGTPASLHLAGHLHPTVRLGGRRRAAVRLPCFVQGPSWLMLPAFSSFTGAGAWQPATGETPWAVVDGEVIACG